MLHSAMFTALLEFPAFGDLEAGLGSRLVVECLDIWQRDQQRRDMLTVAREYLTRVAGSSVTTSLSSNSNSTLVRCRPAAGSRRQQSR